MKTLFFLVVIANVALFMWEYKTGAFVPVAATSEQNADSDQEQILLVSELKNVPQSITPATVTEQPVTENALTDEADKSALEPESLPSVAESIDKPAIEKSVAGNSNFSELKNVPQAITPVTVPEQPVTENALTDKVDKSALVPESLPSISGSIDKSALKKSFAGNSNFSELKNVPQVITPVTVQEQLVTEHALNDEADKLAPVPESLPAKTESIDKSTSEKLSSKESNINDAEKVEALCYEVGPFASTNAYQTWLSHLKDIKSDINPINREEQIPSNYMVYYPVAETELESEATIKMLKNHDIKDIWILSGEDKGKISLGLFSKEESALAMKNELLAKGVNAEVKAKYKTKSQKYALVKGDNKLLERLDAFKLTYPNLVVKPITDVTQSCR